MSELEAACAEVAAGFNARVHAVTRRPPQELLDIERDHLHPVPDTPYSAAFGESRCVGCRPRCRSEVPATRAPPPGRNQGVGAGDGRGGGDHGRRGLGLCEVARHGLLGTGQASVDDAHYPPRRRDPLQREPRSTKADEAAFLARARALRCTSSRRRQRACAASRPAWPKPSLSPPSTATTPRPCPWHGGGGRPLRRWRRGVDPGARPWFGRPRPGAAGRPLAGRGDLDVVAAVHRHRGGPRIEGPGEGPGTEEEQR